MIDMGMVGGGDVFISHSHKDFDKVRLIRNLLEENGFNPLCFYLKCLTDEDEIEGLIKREIDSRSIFVYIESENSRASDWVLKEIQYIRDTKRQIDRTINLDETDDIALIAQAIMSSMKLFLSYSHNDTAIVKIVKDELLKKDYMVFDDTQLSAGSCWLTSIKETIKDISKDGCVILFLSENSVTSIAVQDEIATAKNHGATIIPVAIDDSPKTKEFIKLRALVPLPLSSNPTIDELHTLLDFIESCAVARFVNHFNKP